MVEVRTWMRIAGEIGDEPGLHACGLAYLSDDLPTDAVVSLDRARSARERGVEEQAVEGEFFSASLDHAIYFHRPMAADRWQLQTFTCHGLIELAGRERRLRVHRGRHPRGDGGAGGPAPRRPRPGALTPSVVRRPAGRRHVRAVTRGADAGGFR